MKINPYKYPFFVLEGTDGSGKTEQFTALIRRLKEEGYPVETFDFPQYGKPSAFFVEQYLNGKYGGWEEVGPYKASIFYAIDRFDIGLQISKALKEGKVCVSNRYVASNMGHQGAKITDQKELMKFLKWVYRFEYEIIGIPRPVISIILHMPAEIAQGLVDKKGAREYVGGVKRDIHEADIRHLKRAEQTYFKIAELFPKDFAVVECYENGRILSIDEIHQKVYEIVEKILKRFKGGK
jgi:dTMP kinase